MANLKQQVFLVSDYNKFPEKGFEMANGLAKAYSKDVCFLGVPFYSSFDKDACSAAFESWTASCASSCHTNLNFRVLDKDEDFVEFVELTEASMIVFQQENSGVFSKPMPLLKLCRDLRNPYFFVKPEHNIAFNKILVPVGFLVEEREKGPFSSSFGRFFNSEIALMVAKDYGSKAKQNAEAIRSLILKSDIKTSEVEATKDSFKVEIEAVDVVSRIGADLLMISASRDYGLDDIILGPKELKVIKKSPVPVMLINPRGDLYALCG